MFNVDIDTDPADHPMLSQSRGVAFPMAKELGIGQRSRNAIVRRALAPGAPPNMVSVSKNILPVSEQSTATSFLTLGCGKTMHFSAMRSVQ